MFGWAVCLCLLLGSGSFYSQRASFTLWTCIGAHSYRQAWGDSSTVFALLLRRVCPQKLELAVTFFCGLFVKHRNSQKHEEFWKRWNHMRKECFSVWCFMASGGCLYVRTGKQMFAIFLQLPVFIFMEYTPLLSGQVCSGDAAISRLSSYGPESYNARETHLAFHKRGCLGNAARLFKGVWVFWYAHLN